MSRFKLIAQTTAAEQLRNRIQDLYQYFDKQLIGNEFLAGSTFSIADITALPAVIVQEKSLSDFTRWLQQLKQRLAVQHGMAIHVQEVDHAS